MWYIFTLLVLVAVAAGVPRDVPTVPPFVRTPRPRPGRVGSAEAVARVSAARAGLPDHRNT